MTRRNLPMSALVTGLLAVPALGLAPPPAAGTPATDAAPQALIQTQDFPAEMPAELALLARRLAKGQTPDANGMSELQRRLALDVQNRLAKIKPANPEV